MGPVRVRRGAGCGWLAPRYFYGVVALLLPVRARTYRTSPLEMTRRLGYVNPGFGGAENRSRFLIGGGKSEHHRAGRRVTGDLISGYTRAIRWKAG